MGLWKMQPKGCNAKKTNNNKQDHILHCGAPCAEKQALRKSEMRSDTNMHLAS